MMDSSMPIVDALRADAMAFSGVGRHLANDICFENAFHPSMPVSLICRDNNAFDSFKANLRSYMGQWIEPEYFETCGGSPMTTNPFEYNMKSGTKYFQERMKVFRKATVCVPEDLFNWYVREGLLDSNHTIGLSPFSVPKSLKLTCLSVGLPYKHDPSQLHSGVKKVVNVVKISKPVNAYTIIKAKVPEGWLEGFEVSLFSLGRIQKAYLSVSESSR